MLMVEQWVGGVEQRNAQRRQIAVCQKQINYHATMSIATFYSGRTCTCTVSNCTHSHLCGIERVESHNKKIFIQVALSNINPLLKISGLLYLRSWLRWFNPIFIFFFSRNGRRLTSWMDMHVYVGFESYSNSRFVLGRESCWRFLVASFT